MGETARMELLDRQLNEINDALTGYSADAKLEKEHKKSEKEAAKKRKERENEMREKTMTAEQLAREKQRQKYDKKRERLEMELKKEKEHQLKKDESEREHLGDMVVQQQLRMDQQLGEEKAKILRDSENQADQARLMAEYEKRAKLMHDDQRLQSEKSRAALETRLATRKKAREAQAKQQVEALDVFIAETPLVKKSAPPPLEEKV